MQQITRLIVMLFVALAAGLAAQSTPDFSGRWTSDPDPAAVAAPGAAAPRGGGAPRSGDMGSGWGSTITITQGAGRLTVEYAFFTRGDMQPPLKFVYALDGSETRNTVMMGQGMQQQRATTAWDDGALVIVSVHSFMDPASGKAVPVEVRQRLTLESPTSLIVTTTRGGVLGGPASTTRTVYRKI